MLEQFKDAKSEIAEKQRQSWLKMRQGGRFHFVFYRGVLMWGGTMFVVFVAATAFLLRHDLQRLPALVALNALIWIIGGFVWGTWVWIGCEKRFGTSAR